MSTLVIEVAFWGSVIAALVLWSWYALVIFPLTIVLLSLVVGAIFPLRPTERSEVISARWSALWQTAVLIAVVLCLALIVGK